MFIDLSGEISENTLEEKGEIPCSSKMNHHYDDCVFEGIAKKLMSEFGCVVPWVPLEDKVTGEKREICRF